MLRTNKKYQWGHFNFFGPSKPYYRVKFELVDRGNHTWGLGLMVVLGWTVLVLTPKGSKYDQVVGIMETLWKMVKVTIHSRLCASTHFHDVFHGFRSGRGMETAIMDLKFAQELNSVDHNPPYWCSLK